MTTYFVPLKLGSEENLYKNVSNYIRSRSAEININHYPLN